MFVRFKRKKLADSNGGRDRYSVAAVLVESHRVNGKPRQRILHYLGSTREEALLDPVQKRKFFLSLLEKVDQFHENPRLSAKIKVQLVNRFAKKFHR